MLSTAAARSASSTRGPVRHAARGCLNARGPIGRNCAHAVLATVPVGLLRVHLPDPAYAVDRLVGRHGLVVAYLLAGADETIDGGPAGARLRLGDRRDTRARDCGRAALPDSAAGLYINRGSAGSQRIVRGMVNAGLPKAHRHRLVRLSLLLR